ncbi:uncharacterized protein LOC8284663 [Ricinus communis]|uniref:NAD(P)-binding domain-containing protein n=1 Tax=Ricinus communis TaxID=3988 RepID=B9S5S0_RICCO|nr:uncharacterized protein LOC8284663 [Ricinus communis]EEF41007.1 conserved hypothetical protein [Ricinus communis]|eukprot:XP_002521339.1 uncharacterized protein LOC8284663 isoform X2 [Ricinus communis]
MAGTFSSILLWQSCLSLSYQNQSKSLDFSPIFHTTNNRSLVHCSAKKKIGFMDQILDYIEGGPKLRKWYGAPDLLPKDGSTMQDEDEFSEEEEVRDAILVTDGDSEIGQMVILSLIVKRAKVKALVKDKRSAMEAFGTYVESMAGDTSSMLFIKKALRGVRAIICPKEGFLSSVGSLKGVKHVILLSQLSVYRGSSGIEAMMKSNARKLTEQDESALVASGIPCTIIRVGMLQNTPGGTQGFNFEKGCAEKGSLSKEDAAFICVEALETVPQAEFIFEVVNGEEKVSDWKECLARLMEKAEL